MAVDETYYGLSENWLDAYSQPNVPNDEKWLVANFLDNTGSTEFRTASRLGNAIYKALADNSSFYDATFANRLFNQPLDKSIVFFGMAGSKCPYCNIHYYSNEKEDNTVTEWNMVHVGDESVSSIVNYSLCLTAFNYNNQMGNNQRGYALWLDPNHSASTYDSTYTRWTPEPINHGTKSNSYYEYYLSNSGARNQITPITQYPVRRTVWLPQILAGTITTDENNVESITSVGLYDLATYISTYKATKTAVLSISMCPYSCHTVSDLPTISTPRTIDITPSLISHEYLKGLETLQSFYAPAHDQSQGILIDNENPFNCPLIPLSPYLLLGGPIAYALNSSGSGTSIQTNHQSYDVKLYPTIDCGIIKFNNWLNNGKLVSNTSGTNPVYADATLYTDNEFREAVRSAVACFGMFFADSENNAKTKSLDDSGIFLGTLIDGVGYGDYTEGTDNRNQPQFNWSNMSESPYNPDNPPTPPIVIPPSNPTTFNPVTLANGGLKRYVLDDANMASFGEELWNIIDTTDPDALIQNQTLTNFLTNNPLDCIVSIKRFPLADMSQGTAVNPMLGKVKILNVLAYPFDASSTILSCGSLTIPRFFNDFRDYMVQYELILPFCGTLSLDAESVTGKTIDVKYAIDYTTGTCTAWILTTTSDGEEIVIDSANGNCCIDIPMSGVQTATLTGQIYNANENLKTAKFNTIVSGVTGVGNFIQNVREHNTTSLINQGANLINDIHKIQKAEWNIDHTEIPLKMIGASSGCNSFQIELTPRLTAYVPKTVDGFNYTDYLHTVGASVCDSCTIGNYSGYAEISNVDLSGFNATTTEKNIISNLLSGGVYL